MRIRKSRIIKEKHIAFVPDGDVEQEEIPRTKRKPRKRVAHMRVTSDVPLRLITNKCSYALIAYPIVKSFMRTSPLSFQRIITLYNIKYHKHPTAYELALVSGTTEKVIKLTLGFLHKNGYVNSYKIPRPLYGKVRKTLFLFSLTSKADEVIKHYETELNKHIRAFDLKKLKEEAWRNRISTKK